MKILTKTIEQIHAELMKDVQMRNEFEPSFSDIGIKRKIK